MTHRSDRIADAFPPYVRAGDLLFLSGQVALDTRSMSVVGEDVAEQARYCLDAIRTTLEGAGASLGDVARIECFLTDRADFPRWHEVFCEYFLLDPPARTTVIADLVVPGLRIEVQATARASTR